MSEDSSERVFQEEPVDVSQQYGIMMLTTAGLIMAARFVVGAELAAYLAVAAIAGSGLMWLLPSGKRVIQWRTKRD